MVRCAGLRPVNSAARIETNVKAKVYLFSSAAAAAAAASDFLFSPKTEYIRVRLQPPLLAGHTFLVQLI